MSALHVDLDAFEANLRVIRSRIAPADHMLVVKDDAYGHGLAPIVRRAREAGVGWFGAFDVRTGLAVRDELGPDPRVFVWLIVGEADAAAAVAAELDLGVGDAALLEDVAAAASRLGMIARVHLKADTGLHRNGIRPEDWGAVTRRAAALEASGAIAVEAVWSHLAEASDAEDDLSREVFDTAVARAQTAGLHPRLRHLAASAAGLARPDFRYDLVRIGAFAYGIRPAGGPDETALGVRPIATLTAEVIEVSADAARIDLGALDGLFSSLAGRIRVSTPAGPRLLRAIHRRSAVVDPWAGADVGQPVTIYGPAAHAPGTATDLAEAVGTIGEEVATRLSPGIPREYRAT